MLKLKGFIRKNKNIITLIILLIISSCMIIFANTDVMYAPNQIGTSFFSFFQNITGSIGKWFSNLINSIGKVEELKKELAQTQEELLQYERISRDIISLRKENQELKNELQLLKAVEFEYIPAEIIAWNTEHNFGTVTIYKGKLAGIEKNMPVIAFQAGLQGLVGRVIAVSLNSATVLTLVDPSSYVSARFQDSDYVGLVNGRGINSPYLIMTDVKKPAASDIQYGDIVETSGLGGVYPKGIALGRYRKIQASEYDTSLTLEIEPVIDFSRIEYIYVLKVKE
jgi:rod shape-determining protein MreC